MFQSQPGILHAIIGAFFSLLILMMIIRMVLSWVVGMMNMQQGHPIIRFFYNVTDPLIDPVARRIPRASMGVIDLGATVAFIFAWWGLSMLSDVITSALPLGW